MLKTKRLTVDLNQVKEVKFDPDALRLNERLNELPRAAYKRINPESVGIAEPRFKSIILKRIKKIKTLEILAFCEVLKCNPEEFLDPDFVFVDFRTRTEKNFDLNPFNT